MDNENIEQRLKDINEISIAIDTFDDIFSDFDPRPLNDRVLSEDFISELKKRYRETSSGNPVVTIHAPISLKDEKVEKMVVQRIKRYLKYSSLLRKKEINMFRVRGLIFVVSGIVLLVSYTVINHYKLAVRLTRELIGIILLPLGWFGIWEGCSKIVDTSPRFIQDYKLLDRLSKADYKFIFLEPKKTLEQTA